MKKNIYLIIFIQLIINYSSFAQFCKSALCYPLNCQNYNFAVKSPDDDIYLSGQLTRDTTNFGNGVRLIQQNETKTCLAKYSYDGTCKFAKTIGSKDDNVFLNDIIFDKTGNYYLLGSTSNPNLEISNGIKLNGNTPGRFILKFNNKDECLYANFLPDSINILKFKLDNFGNLFFLAMFYYANVSWNDGTVFTNPYPGANCFALVKTDDKLKVINSNLIKSNNLRYENIFTIGDEGNVYFAGYYEKEVDFGSNKKLNNDLKVPTSFLAKYNNDCSIISAESLDPKVATQIKNLVVNPSGDLILSGNFYSDSLNLGTGSLLNKNFQRNGYFLLKINKDNKRISANSLITSVDIELTNLECDSQNNIYLAGTFGAGYVMFSQDIFVNYVESKHSTLSNAFFAKYSPKLECEFACKVGALDRIFPQICNITKSGKPIFSGFYNLNEAYFGNGISVKQDFNSYLISSNFFIVNYDDLSLPELKSPYNKETKVNPKVKFIWHKASGAKEYCLEVSKDENFTNLVLKGFVSDTFNIVSNALNNDYTYYWRVKSIKLSDTTCYSETWKFTTGKLIGNNINLVSPKNFAKDTERNPTLDWDATNGAEAYIVEVSEDLNFSPLTFRNVTTSTFQNIPQLNKNTVYYWRVKAYNFRDTSDWSPIWSFQTGIQTQIENDNNMQDFLIYPNPTNNRLNFKLNSYLGNICSVNMYNIFGELVLCENYNIMSTNYEGIIDISKLSPGLYNISITGNSDIFRKSFIITK